MIKSIQSDKENYSPRISVILPTFHVEPYIDYCIESLQNQTFRDLEFIFVDDCSGDASLVPVEVWANQDRRVRILRNKENLGPGLSRNLGLSVARGEYCSFVDPDDWLSADYYALLYRHAAEKQAVIAKGRRARVYPDGKIDTSRSEALNNAILNRHRAGRPLFSIFNAEHQSAIYRTAFLKNNGIGYGRTRNAEDTTFLLRLCTIAENISIVPEAIYFYRLYRPGAATENYSFSRSFNEIEAVDEQFQCLFSDKAVSECDDFATRALLTVLTRYSIVQENEQLTESQISDIQSRFVKRLNLYPNSKELVRQYPELTVMARHGYAIPVYYEIPEHFRNRRGERWVSYLASHHSEGKEMLDACAAVIREYLSTYGNKELYEDAPPDPRKYVDELLAPLSPAYRSYISESLDI